MRYLPVPALLFVLIAAACGDDDASGSSTTQAESPNTAPFESTTTAAPTAAPTSAVVTEAPVPADPNRLVAAGDEISVHYVGTLDDGEQFDSSRDRGQPLSFTVGIGQMISGFDAAVVGMKIGDVKTVTLSPAEAYGERTDPDVITVTLDQLPPDVTAGQTLFSQTGQQALVVEVGETEATLEVDSNHPLAGQSLTFEIEMVSFEN